MSSVVEKNKWVPVLSVPTSSLYQHHDAVDEWARRTLGISCIATSDPPFLLRNHTSQIPTHFWAVRWQFDNESLSLGVGTLVNIPQHP